MRFSIATAWIDPAELPAIAREADRLGYHALSISDHVVNLETLRTPYPYTADGERRWNAFDPWVDPMVAIGALGAVTERLRFFTNVYVLPMRDPFTVAKTVATASIFTGGRVSLGVGMGWCEDEFRIMGPDFGTRGARMDEMLSIMRQFWETGECAFEGSHFSFPTVGQQPQPARRIPVWVGGKSRAALRRAARNDGWLGMNYGMEEIHALLARRFVIPEAMPSHDVYRQLEDWGVDGTVALCWGIDDPAYFPLERKLEGMEAFARTYLR